MWHGEFSLFWREFQIYLNWLAGFRNQQHGGDFMVNALFEDNHVFETWKNKEKNRRKKSRRFPGWCSTPHLVAQQILKAFLNPDFWGGRGKGR